MHPAQLCRSFQTIFFLLSVLARLKQLKIKEKVGVAVIKGIKTRVVVMGLKLILHVGDIPTLHS